MKSLMRYDVFTVFFIFSLVFICCQFHNKKTDVRTTIGSDTTLTIKRACLEIKESENIFLRLHQHRIFSEDRVIIYEEGTLINKSAQSIDSAVFITPDSGYITFLIDNKHKKYRYDTITPSITRSKDRYFYSIPLPVKVESGNRYNYIASRICYNATKKTTDEIWHYTDTLRSIFRYLKPGVNSFIDFYFWSNSQNSYCMSCPGDEPFTLISSMEEQIQQQWGHRSCTYDSVVNIFFTRNFDHHPVARRVEEYLNYDVLSKSVPSPPAVANQIDTLSPLKKHMLARKLLNWCFNHDKVRYLDFEIEHYDSVNSSTPSEQDFFDLLNQKTLFAEKLFSHVASFVDKQSIIKLQDIFYSESSSECDCKKVYDGNIVKEIHKNGDTVKYFLPAKSRLAFLALMGTKAEGAADQLRYMMNEGILTKDAMRALLSVSPQDSVEVSMHIYRDTFTVEGPDIIFESNRRMPEKGCDIYVMKPNGKNVRLLLSFGMNRYLEKPVWSPDHRKIAFQEMLGPIYIADADGKNCHRLNGSIVNDDLPCWSPDGKKILFSRIINNVGVLFIVNVDGGEPIMITDGKTYSYYPSWSPDGKEIAFCRHVGQSGRIFIMDVDGKNLRQVTFGLEKTTSDNSPKWSPDGKFIAFIRNNIVYKMNADGSNIENVGLQPFGNGAMSLSWSPDGKKIVFCTPVGNYTQIYLMNSDGENQVILSDQKKDDTYYDRNPSW